MDLRTCFVAPFLLITRELIADVLREVISESSELIEDLNRQQLYAGTNVDGSPIEPDYTKFTVFLKQKKGQVTDRVTLRDKGDLYESIFTEVFTNAFILDADDPKTTDLKAKYGPKLFGLSIQSKLILMQQVTPNFVLKLKNRIGL